MLHDERVWKRRAGFLKLGNSYVDGIIDAIATEEGIPKGSLSTSSSTQSSKSGDTVAKVPNSPPVLEVSEDDEFGDFASAPLATTLQTNNLLGGGSSFGFTPPSSTNTLGPHSSIPNGQAIDPKFVLRNQYIHAHRSLVRLSRRLLNTAPHLLLSSLFPSSSSSGSPPSILDQAHTLALLMRFLSPVLQPTLNWRELRQTLLSAVDRFQASALAAFESASSSIADAGTKIEEARMRDAAWASWEVWEEEHLAKMASTNISKLKGGADLPRGEWEIGRVWMDKLEIFYEGSRWDPSLNFT